MWLVLVTAWMVFRTLVDQCVVVLVLICMYIGPCLFVPKPCVCSDVPILVAEWSRACLRGSANQRSSCTPSGRPSCGRQPLHSPPLCLLLRWWTSRWTKTLDTNTYYKGRPYTKDTPPFGSSSLKPPSSGLHLITFIELLTPAGTEVFLVHFLSV